MADEQEPLVLTNNLSEAGPINCHVWSAALVVCQRCFRLGYDAPFCCRKAATEHSPGQVRSTQPWVTARIKRAVALEGRPKGHWALPSSNASICIKLFSSMGTNAQQNQFF
jgi:hypothetical protein